MKRGDIVWVELPQPSTQGREQFGRRPAVIIQDENQFKNTPTVVLIPLTSQKIALRFPATILITPTLQNGLQVESVALVHQVRAIDRKRVQQHIGTLEAQSLLNIESLLKKVVGF